MRTLDQYLDLVEPQHRSSPRFMATVGLSADVWARLQAFLDGMPLQFDLDYAVGPQLDVDGQWIGQSRQVPYPVPGVYFSLDDPVRGLDRGFIQGPYDTTYALYSLDDETYRRLLRARIQLNHWDGTVDGIISVISTYFNDPSTLITVQDDSLAIIPTFYFSLDDPTRGLDLGSVLPDGGSSLGSSQPTLPMVVTVGLSGRHPNQVDLAILAQGLLAPVAIGAVTDILVNTVDQTPLFGLDMETPAVSGLDVGSLGVSPSYAQANGI